MPNLFPFAKKQKSVTLKVLIYYIPVINDRFCPTISPQTKMSKFAKTKFLLCRVVGVFPSRGSTFFLARQCFGAFTNAPIGGGVCKNFYTFFTCFSPVLSPNHLLQFCILSCIKVVGKMRKIAELEHKRGGFRGKNARKVGKTNFSYECRKRAKRCTKRVFWAKNWAKRAQKQRFSCKLDKYRIILTFNALHKNRRFFALKTLHFVCICKSFCKLLHN